MIYTPRTWDYELLSRVGRGSEEGSAAGGNLVSAFQIYDTVDIGFLASLLSRIYYQPYG